MNPNSQARAEAENWVLGSRRKEVRSREGVPKAQSFRGIFCHQMGVSTGGLISWGPATSDFLTECKLSNSRSGHTGPAEHKHTC